MTEDELSMHERLAAVPDHDRELEDPTPERSILALAAEVRRLRAFERQASKARAQAVANTLNEAVQAIRRWSPDHIGLHMEADEARQITESMVNAIRPRK